MGLDYVIQYKKGKENIVVDALSRCQEEGELSAISTLVPDWYQELASSYESDEGLKQLLGQLVLDPTSRWGYTLRNGMIRYHGRIVIGDLPELKERMLQTLHESPLGGHSGIQNTYHKV